jgi:hypothetical protein
MANASQHSGYAGQSPPGSYGWYPTAGAGSTDRSSRLDRSLWIIVAILGSATFGASFGSPVGSGFPVQFAVLAAVVAATGLLPKQGGRGWVVVALAVTGFLDALATWITADEQWALTVVLVLNALQAMAAVVALLYETRRLASAEPRDGLDYSAYAQSVQAYQAYAAQYQQAAAASYGAAGQATARAQSEARTSARAPASAQEAPPAGLEARYAAHGGGTSGRQQSRNSAQPSTAPTGNLGPGVPNANHGAPESHPYRTSPSNPGDGTIEMNGP